MAGDWQAAAKTLSVPLSVPTGHPVRLGEQVSPVLPPWLPPPLQPHSWAPGPLYGWERGESGWYCSPPSLPWSHRGETEAHCMERELGLGSSIRKPLLVSCTFLLECCPRHGLLPPLDPSGLGAALQASGLCHSRVCGGLLCSVAAGLVLGSAPHWGIKSVLVLRLFRRGVPQPCSLNQSSAPTCLSRRQAAGGGVFRKLSVSCSCSVASCLHPNPTHTRLKSGVVSALRLASCVILELAGLPL